MFGFVNASLDELSKEQQDRYRAVYCGICRAIGQQDAQLCRLALSYDMAFLALLLMSLYEPEESAGAGRCIRHPFKPREYTDNEYIRYAARMNVILACYQAKDDRADEGKPGAALLERIFGRNEPEIRAAYPRQCDAITRALETLGRLEQENCPNPDEPANAFGALMAELLVYREDRWAEDLRELGFCLGRFIYLADAAADWRQDQKRGNYNPWLAGGKDPEPDRWEEHLILSMAGCTDAYERLPLVQDKELLDNILYSGVWVSYGMKQKKSRKENQHGGSL